MMIRRSVVAGLGVAFALCASVSARAAELAGAPLARALQSGGYVLLMRHAASPPAIADKSTAEPDNTKPERQLDQTGKDTARAMGIAFKTLRIPVGDIFSSPTYRAQQTIKLAGFGLPTLRDELGDNGRSMAPEAVAGWSLWLKAKVAEKPRAGTNTILVTHFPNITAAFPDEAKGLVDGETIIFRPDGARGEIVAHVRIEDWPQLAAAR